MPPKRQKRVGEPLASDTPQPPPSDNDHVKKRRRIEREFRRAVGKHVSDDGSDEDTDSDTDSTLSGDSSSDSKNLQTKLRDLKDESGSYNGDRGRGQKQEQEQQKEGDDDDDDEIWEILLDETKSVDRKSVPIKPSENLGDGDLTLTLDKSNSSSLPMKKRGVSSRERRERLYTHIVHVICLMYHGHRRNVWLNDKELWGIILKCMEESFILMPQVYVKEATPKALRGQYLQTKKARRKEFKDSMIFDKGPKISTDLGTLELNFLQHSSGLLDSNQDSCSVFARLEQWIAIDPLVTGLILSKDDMSRLEPKGRIASKSKQQISYVIAYSTDNSARDVTVRYLSGMVFPGKTKGLRMPVFGREVLSNQGDFLMTEEFDLFSERILKCFQPCSLAKTARDLKEDRDLLPNASTESLNPFKRDFPKSIAAYKNHLKYVLERHLKREDCILPGELPVHTLATGKASAIKEEKVYSRQSIIVGKPAENWYREGRVIKKNEHPLKTVPSRAVTTNRKREIEDAKREGNIRAGLVGLYGFYQTEIYRPPPIIDGVIPKNAYGNIDCFVPSMVPVGAVHVPWGNAVRLSKKLGIEFAEAVTGFDFKNKRAVPRTEGVLCSEENADVLTEACRQDDEQKRLKDDEKRQQICLALWKRFLIGLRIVERIEENYGSGTSEPAAVQETEDTGRDQEQEVTAAPDSGDNSDLEEGGFFRE
ncbi:hypothetical protein TWF191_001417 [Orbilia oligospora]|uniref:Uncharacterized protein n=1 Tax=Orbilia oligospora TaxID=2813651 RepID=A0A7C8QCP7_ORBOL|nr:hypothetical protein TWF191_001417 [Orbilia oligospora]